MEPKLRTTIDIDAELLAEAIEATGLKTKKDTVEEALRLVGRQHRQRLALARLKGIGWEGDLDVMREGRDFDR
jgi:Arc/MetJ family transcription regulator